MSLPSISNQDMLLILYDYLPNTSDSFNPASSWAPVQETSNFDSDNYFNHMVLTRPDYWYSMRRRRRRMFDSSMDFVRRAG